MSNLPTILHNKYFKELLGLDKKSPLKKYVDFPEVLAINNVNFLFGNSFTFSTDDDKLLTFWNSFVSKSRFQTIIEKMIYNLSKYGQLVLGFDRLENLAETEDAKGFRLYMSEPNFYLHKKYVFENLAEATFITQKTPEDINGVRIPILIRETVNKRGTTRDFWTTSGLLEGGLVVPGSKMTQEQVNKNSEIVNRERYTENKFKNKKGEYILPLQDFSNYSFANYPEWALCRALIEDYVKAREYEEYERKTNKTRVIINARDEKSKTEIEKILKNDNKNEGADRFFLTLPLGNGEQNGINENLLLVPSTFDSNLHVIAQKEKLAMIFAFTGNSFQTGTTTNTATEVQHNSSNKTKSFMRKRKHFNDTMRLFLENLFIAAGFEGVEFSFALHENEAVSQQDRLNQIMSAVDSGLMSRLDAIAKMNNISKGDAEAKLLEIQEEEKENEAENLRYDKEIAAAQGIEDEENAKDEMEEKNEKKETKDIKSKKPELKNDKQSNFKKQSK